MTEPQQGPQLLTISSVECSPPSRDRIVVRVTGTWLGRHRIALGRALLVVETDGRRHRFPVTPEARTSRLEQQSGWSASFAMPAWLQPYLMRGARLQLGTMSVPLPPITVKGDSEQGVPPASAPAARGGSPRPLSDAGAQLTARIRHLERSLAAARQEPARLTGLAAKAQADLNARTAQFERLHSAHANLRDELARQRSATELERTRRTELESMVSSLMDTVADLRVELAEAVVSRDAALEEVTGLRDELDRLGAAVTAAREEEGPGAARLTEAESLLAEARSVTARITERFGTSLPAADDA